MLILKNVTKKFDHKTILDGINLEIKSGSVALFIGSSGVGKSTLLRTLCGLETITQGSITLDGLPLSGKNNSIGMVFQHFNLFSHMNVITNITFPLEKSLGYAPKTAKLIALELLHKYDLADKALLCVKSLSGGQKQRLALARTLALKPNVICFDEPTSALDPLLTTQVARTITQLAKEGYMILITTHDTLLIEKLPCIIYLMKKGTIIESVFSVDYWKDPLKYPLLHDFINGHQAPTEKT